MFNLTIYEDEHSNLVIIESNYSLRQFRRWEDKGLKDWNHDSNRLNSAVAIYDIQCMRMLSMAIDFVNRTHGPNKKYRIEISVETATGKPLSFEVHL